MDHTRRLTDIPVDLLHFSVSRLAMREVQEAGWLCWWSLRQRRLLSSPRLKRDKDGEKDTKILRPHPNVIKHSSFSLKHTLPPININIILKHQPSTLPELNLHPSYHPYPNPSRRQPTSPNNSSHHPIPSLVPLSIYEQSKTHRTFPHSDTSFAKRQASIDLNKNLLNILKKTTPQNKNENKQQQQQQQKDTHTHKPHNTTWTLVYC